MGISLYVMPFTRYLTGRFKTTWESRSETAGKPGFRIGPGGVEEPPGSNGLSSSEAAAWLGRFKASLAERFVNTDWEDDGEVLFAGSFSYSSIGHISDVAGRWAGRARFAHLADPVCPYWIPSRFPRPLRVPDPGGGEEPITVLSSVEAREELTRLVALHQEDPRKRDIESLPAGSILSGNLAEYEDERTVLSNVLYAATRSVERRVPVIVEG